MNWLDYSIIGVVTASLLFGLLRGFTREALNLGSWILAFVATLLLAPSAEALLRDHIGWDVARLVIAYAGVFIVALIIGSVVTHIVSSSIRRTPFSGPDRVLGGMFGVGRGLVIVVVAATLAGLTVIVDESWWQESALMPYFDPAAEWTRAQLPESWIEEIRPHRPQPGEEE